MTAVWYVKITAKEGEEARVRDGLGRLVAPTRAEDGCLVFEVNQDLADPRVFTIYEQWRDEAAHDAHVRTDHFRDLAKAEVIDRSEPMESRTLALI
jgi:quinol monooxygenase YgiN